MKFQVVKSETSVILTVFIQDSSSTTGAGLGGLIHTSSIVGGYVKRNGTGVALAVDEDVTTEGTYQAPSAAGKVRIGTPANMTAGTYELHFHNDLFTTADWLSITLGGATNMAPLTIEVQLTGLNLNDSVRAGLTALPNAAADAAGGVPISDAGGLDMDGLATAEQVSQIGSGGGSANNEFAIPSPNGFVITTGLSEVNNEDATRALGGIVHQISDNAGTLDVYYLHDIGGAFSPNTIVFTGRMNGNNQDVVVYVNTNTQASPTWVEVATLEGQASSISIEHVWKLENSDQMVGADAGKVAVRFQATGLSSATLTTDQIVVEKTTIASVTGYQDGQIWVNTLSGTAGTVVNVNGVADKAVLTWADAVTISTSGDFANDFHIINGSTIALTGTSDKFSLFGDNWILQLASRSVAGAYFQGAHVSGVGTSATEVHYEGCDVATMSVQIGHFDFCTFSGTVTHTLAGDYNYHNCKSMVAGPNGPTFAKTAGQAITAQWRSWAGSINLTGLEVGDTLTIGGTELGTIDLGSPAGAVVVEIRGIYKALANIGSASVNLDGAILASDVALILADSNELQSVLSAGILARTNNPTLNALLGVADTAGFDIAYEVLDEVNTGARHNIVNSLGRQVREGTSVVIGAFDVISATANAVTIDGSASAVAGSYDPSRVFVYEGTGMNQGGVVTEYFGSAGGNSNPARTLIFKEDFKVVLDSSSKLLILANDGRMSTNQGQLRGGSTTTATLNALSPGADVSGQTLHFTSGTGQDQVALISSYADPIASFSAIDVAVDNTTGYELLPIGCVNVEAILNDAQSATDLKDFADAGYDPGTNKVQGVVLVDTVETVTDLTVTTFAEPSSVPAAAATIPQMLHWLFTLGRNKLTATKVNDTTATTSLKGDDESTEIAASTTTDDGTTATRGEYT